MTESSIGGLSVRRLGRLRDALARHIEAGLLPGAVTVVCRRGEIYVDAIGTKAMGTDDAMRRDSIFRISSMTKPVTAVATMILIEECKLRLDEPVDRLLPELAGRRVLERFDGPIDMTVPAHRPVTVRDLLTFRMGFGMLWGHFEGKLPIQKAAAERELSSLGPPRRIPLTPDEWIKRFGELPLMFQPGERWLYNTGSYVLGVLIARASGQPFETFLRERIFEPLGMKDTAFNVPVGKRDRFTTAYMANPQTGILNHSDPADATSQWADPPIFPDGGAGLVSTADDFLAFARMLLGGGKLGSVRILSRPSVEAMTTDYLTAEQKVVSAWWPGQLDHRGWGFGVSVVTGRDGPGMNPGRYGWDGGYGTAWANDPREEMAAMMLTQRGAFPLFDPVHQDFWASVYQAIDD